MMINFDVPFCENTDDDTHCFQACLKMVLGYFLPERHFSWQALDQMTNKRSGEPTWPMAGVCWLVENGFDVQYIELFDYRKFLEKKSAYLCERWSEDMANYALETDIESEMPYVESFINTVRYKNRIASLNDVKHALKDGFICILNVNVRSLYNNEGYSGHYIVIKGIHKNEFIIHDPGRPGKKDQKVSFIQLQNGWSYPNKTSNNLLAIKL
jgi:hypothetical protein